MLKHISCIITAVLITLSPVSLTLSLAAESLPARVTDISDRAYEPAVIELLDNAKESIYISMYVISTRGNAPNPATRLITNLLEARGRGVKVTLYLNTRFNDSTEARKSLLTGDKYLKELADAGCEIHFMPLGRRLHDKLIIVDSRYVVEASTNWSISALRINFESATLIDSLDLARVKLKRLGSFTHHYDSLPPARPQPLYVETLPKDLTISSTLLYDKRLFPKMLSRHNDRGLSLYLLLLAHAQSQGRLDFFIDLESMALSLGLPSSWSDSALRRQIIKSLKGLDSSYGLIKTEFFHSKDARVTLKAFPGNVFTVPVRALEPATPARVKYFLMIGAVLSEQGEYISTMSDYELADRFPVSRRMLCDARRDAK